MTRCDLQRSQPCTSWLNQIEIYYSVLQRKLLTPLEATSPEELATHILAFQDHYEQIATPFKWEFTRADLDRLLASAEPLGSRATMA